MHELQVNQNFSNIQLELLKLYSTNIKDSELMEIKNYLAKYFAQKAVSRADSIWDAKGFDNDEFEGLMKEPLSPDPI